MIHTIAKIKFKYCGKTYTIKYDFGPDYPWESALFMFEDGNYGCDCNRSIFIKREYGDKSIPELPCGGKIEMVSIKQI